MLVADAVGSTVDVISAMVIISVGVSIGFTVDEAEETLVGSAEFAQAIRTKAGRSIRLCLMICLNVFIVDTPQDFSPTRLSQANLTILHEANCHCQSIIQRSHTISKGYKE